MFLVFFRPGAVAGGARAVSDAAGELGTGGVSFGKLSEGLRPRLAPYNGAYRPSPKETVMGFTVTHQAGTKDVEFDAYGRLLQQKGVDLAKLNRVPEPGTSRRWLYVWNVEADAQVFADELKKRTHPTDA
jgi:hypothetical protein